MLTALSGTMSMNGNLLTDFRIAKETGHFGIEINGAKLKRYLAQGYSLGSLAPLLKETPALGMTQVENIERQEAEEYKALLEECEDVCAKAEALGCPLVQLLTGPLSPYEPYQGLTGRAWPKIRDLTAKNLKALAKIGRDHKVKFFIEQLAWTPIHKLEQVIETIDAAGEDNVGIVIDFWHLWSSGATPEQIAKVNKNLIHCVHFCDSLDQWGERGTYEQPGRNVWTGYGRIPLKEWTDAVLATGFDGYWACEMFGPKYWELDPWRTARDSKAFMEYLLM